VVGWCCGPLPFHNHHRRQVDFYCGVNTLSFLSLTNFLSPCGRSGKRCAGINRHAVEDEREERGSGPPGLETCGGSREAAVES
jgi:hypothetical protein